MVNFIIIAIIVVAVAAALIYIIKAKKSGAKCIGCPDAGCCGKKNDGSACHCGDNNR